MTKKEKLYLEILEVRNQVYVLQGEQDKCIENLEKYSECYPFQSYARVRKVADLEKELAIAKQALKDAQNKARQEAYFETEEGKAFKKDVETKIENNRKAEKALREEAHATLNKFVQDLLGKDFAVTRFCWDYFEVALIKEYAEDGTPIGLFGHEFSVHYYSNKWELNYGTMGAFDMCEDKTRARYLQGLATFANSERVKDVLKGIAQSLKKVYLTLCEEMRGLQEELKNAGLD